jgi:hypothetical protein
MVIFVDIGNSQFVSKVTSYQTYSHQSNFWNISDFQFWPQRSLPLYNTPVYETLDVERTTCSRHSAQGKAMVTRPQHERTSQPNKESPSAVEANEGAEKLRENLPEAAEELMGSEVSCL